MKKLLCLLLISFCTVIFSAEITGKVISILDGDTIKIEDSDGGKFKIRFSDMDAPEKTQLHGPESTAYLKHLLENKEVLIKFTTIDVYGRIVGTVYTGKIIGKVYKTNVNEEMVRTGNAWWYKAYSKNTKFEELEKEARKNKVGIWKFENPQPPWEYRAEQRKEKLKAIINE